MKRFGDEKAALDFARKWRVGEPLSGGGVR